MNIFYLSYLHRDGTEKFSHTVKNEPQQSQANQDDISTLGHGVLCCFSNSAKFFALCTPQKELLVWQTSDWKLLSKRFHFILINLFCNTHLRFYSFSISFPFYLGMRSYYFFRPQN